MSWQPNGRYYSFNLDVIRACVPEASGVYGLFNFRRQLFIGEAENIQAALLRHLVDRGSQAWRYRATRFSFQLCPADERTQKAAELIEQYRPARQSEAAPTEPAPSAAEPAPIGPPLEEIDHAPIDLEEFSMHERESSPPAEPRYYFERAQGATLIGLFAVCMIVSFYLGILAGENLQRQANSASVKVLAWTQAPEQQVAVDLSEQNAAVKEAAGNLSVHIPGWMPASMEPETPIAALDKIAPQSAPRRATGTAGVQQAGTAAAVNGDASRKWSVQIAAAPARDVADALAEGLVGEGFDSYVVQAQVKGQTFYRVRVGPLDAQEKAESVRQTLARQERYRDAFLVNE